MATTFRARRRSTIIATVVALGIIGAACSSSGSGKTSGTGADTTPTTAGTPKPGGSVTFALPAETSGGWCLQEGQLAISGIQVARAIYDTLVVPDSKEKYKPFLAESVTPNADNTKWTIKLRSGIKFHDGSDLDATVVKNNIDAYRGKYPARSPLLFSFVFGKYILDTKLIDPMTVEIDTVPWTAFPAYLYSSGRLGIVAQAQLDDTKTCASKLIGTGPFKLQDWKRNDHFTAVKNPNYWRKDANGVQLPYLDSITFKPIVESAQMVNGIQAGDIDLALDDGPINIVQYRDLAKSGTINLTESDKYPELSYTLFNVTKDPFNNKNARLAVAYAVDREQQNVLRNKGILQLASGPFGPGTMGYLKDTGLPEYNLQKAKDYVAKYKQDTGKSELAFTYLSAGTDPEGLKTIALIKTYVTRAGMKMTVKTVDESQGINNVIAKAFDAVGWRNHPGYDPDTEWVWWHCDNDTVPCDNPVNFNGFNDDVINKALEEGRAATDEATRRTAYETVNKRFATELYNGWGYWDIWTIPAQKKVHGIGNLPLPDGSSSFPGLTSGIDPAGIWVDQ